MKKNTALYKELIDAMSSICGSDDNVEAYWNSLTLEDQSLFDGIVDRLSDEKTVIGKCKINLDVYESYEPLKLIFSDFNKSFSSFPGFAYKKILFLIAISEKIFMSSSEIPDTNVCTEFSTLNVSLGLPSIAFVTNVTDYKNNICWFSPSDMESIKKLVEFDADIENWYSFLSLVNVMDFSSAGEIICCRTDCISTSGKNKNLITFLKLHMASVGQMITPINNYLKTPSNSSLDNFDPSQSYSQFEDTIHVIGEYNNRTDALSKYLSIYHVIENFMFKYPIVKLERENSGSMFSMRNFKSLYKASEVSEQKALDSIIKSASTLSIDGGDFCKFSHEYWKKYLINNKKDMKVIEYFLKRFSTESLSSITKVKFPKYLSNLIYQVRCSIVHNKETEYHIAGENYVEESKVVIEGLLLPLMEEFVFLLLSKENDLVWYKSDSIMLWEKTA
jgi:hypothetical protein